MPRRWVFLLVILLPVACRSAGDEPTDHELDVIDRTLEAMSRRLDLMPDVARTKWNEQRAISDPGREAELIDGFARGAAEKGEDAEFTRAVLSGQIEAAKLVQQALFERWRSEGRGRFDRTVPLAALRDSIDAATVALLDAGATLRPLLIRPRVRRALERRGESVLGEYSPEVRAAAVGPLLR